MAGSTTLGAMPARDEAAKTKAGTAKAGRGRPRTEGTGEAILAATLEMVAEVGINGMSMDDLAARAGVSKATVYRRWPSKEQLVIDALASALRPFDDIDTGSLRRDLDLYLGELVSRMRSGAMNDVLPHLIEAGFLDPQLQSSLDQYVQHRRRPLHNIFSNARDRGDLVDMVDLDVLIDALLGPLVYRRLLTREPVDEEFLSRLLPLILPSVTSPECPDEFRPGISHSSETK